MLAKSELLDLYKDRSLPFHLLDEQFGAIRTELARAERLEAENTDLEKEKASAAGGATATIALMFLYLVLYPQDYALRLPNMIIELVVLIFSVFHWFYKHRLIINNKREISSASTLLMEFWKKYFDFMDITGNTINQRDARLVALSSMKDIQEVCEDVLVEQCMMILELQENNPSFEEIHKSQEELRRKQQVIHSLNPEFDTNKQWDSFFAKAREKITEKKADEQKAAQENQAAKESLVEQIA